MHLMRAADEGYSLIHSYICMSMCVCVCLCHAPWPNEKWYTPEIWYKLSARPYLKNAFFCFFEKETRRAGSLEKLQCHVDFLHIFSTALFHNINHLISFSYGVARRVGEIFMTPLDLLATVSCFFLLCLWNLNYKVFFCYFRCGEDYKMVELGKCKNIHLILDVKFVI